MTHPNVGAMSNTGQPQEKVHVDQCPLHDAPYSLHETHVLFVFVWVSRTAVAMMLPLTLRVAVFFSLAYVKQMNNYCDN